MASLQGPPELGACDAACRLSDVLHAPPASYVNESWDMDMWAFRVDKQPCCRRHHVLRLLLLELAQSRLAITLEFGEYCRRPRKIAALVLQTWDVCFAVLRVPQTLQANTTEPSHKFTNSPSSLTPEGSATAKRLPRLARRYRSLGVLQPFGADRAGGLDFESSQPR